MLKIIIYILFILSSIYSMYYLITARGILKNKKDKMSKNKEYNNFAIIIPARNEEEVIKSLIRSLNKQNYPKDKYKINVIVNNSNDNTAKNAKEENANVIICNKKVKSKGDVLKFTFDYFKDNKDITAYIIFDADNIVDNNFLKEMNNTLNNGYNVAQGYRDTKNIYDNWLTNSYAILYYLQNYFLNKSRFNLGRGAFLNGTGVMIKKSIIDKYGFNIKTLTEDIEFTALCAINGEKIAFVENAITYDEQVSDIKISLKQRKRWSYGTKQCLKEYFIPLLKTGIKKHNYECFGIILFYLSIILHILFSLVPILTIIYYIINPNLINHTLILNTIIYLVISYLIGLIFKILLIKKCNKSIIKSIKGILLFDLFLLTWLPINFICLFKNSCTWDHIKHNRNIT